jgi:hypothetical protein
MMWFVWAYAPINNRRQKYAMYLTDEVDTRALFTHVDNYDERVWPL